MLCSLEAFHLWLLFPKLCVLENLKKVFFFQKRDILEERMTYFLEGKCITRAAFYVVNFEVGRCTSL